MHVAVHVFSKGLQPSSQVFRVLKHYSGCCRYFREGFQRATADLVERELQRFERPEEIEIFFSAHGVPVSYVEQVSPGADHVFGETQQGESLPSCLLLLLFWTQTFLLTEILASQGLFVLRLTPGQVKRARGGKCLQYR